MSTARERGSMAVEVVIMVPILVAVMMLVVAFGRYIDLQGSVDAAARDAVRAASLERDAATAEYVAQQVAMASLPESASCSDVSLEGNFAPGEVITVVLTCQVSYDGLGLLGLPGSAPVTADSSAPLDELRRTE